MTKQEYRFRNEPKVHRYAPAPIRVKPRKNRKKKDGYEIIRRD